MSHRTVAIDKWRSPASAYPRKTLGFARLKTSWYPPGHYHCYMQHGYLLFEATRRLYITALEIDGEVWMVDDPPHWWAMEDHAAAYTGHVICAGLGLGLIVHALDANDAVTRITVVEREQDVIDLVGPLVPDRKLEIVRTDWETFDPQSVPPADGVLYDLFVGDARDLTAAAIHAAADVLLRWEADEDFVVRVHGFHNESVIAAARAVAYHATTTPGGTRS